MAPEILDTQLGAAKLDQHPNPHPGVGQHPHDQRVALGVGRGLQAIDLVPLQASSTFCTDGKAEVGLGPPRPDCEVDEPAHRLDVAPDDGARGGELRRLGDPSRAHQGRKTPRRG